MSKIVKVEYDAAKPETKITADGKEFDTSRIKGREIEDCAHKVTWNIKALDGEKQCDLVFSGLEEALGDAPVT